ncbi:hypothetical protein D3C72_377440 [compost metagenome]
MPSDRPDTYFGNFSLMGLHRAGQRGSLPPGYLKEYLENQRQAHVCAERLISLSLGAKNAAHCLRSPLSGPRQ